MDFISFIYLAVFSLCVILAGKYLYTLISSNGGNSIAMNENEYDNAADAVRQIQHADFPDAMPAPLNPIIENQDGTTSLDATTGDDYRARIPLSEPSRTQGGTLMEGLSGDSGPTYEPVQLLNPIPNDRLMPISGAKDDPIRTRLDTAESMGLYQNILEKEMGQASGTGANKNRYFEMGPRDSAYHLYGTAEGNSFDKQAQFGGGNAPLTQPKHRNFDLGFEINYKELDQKMYADKQKFNGNLLAVAASSYH